MSLSDDYAECKHPDCSSSNLCFNFFPEGDDKEQRVKCLCGHFVNVHRKLDKASGSGSSSSSTGCNNYSASSHSSFMTASVTESPSTHVPVPSAMPPTMSFKPFGSEIARGNVKVTATLPSHIARNDPFYSGVDSKKRSTLNTVDLTKDDVPSSKRKKASTSGSNGNSSSSSSKCDKKSALTKSKVKEETEEQKDIYDLPVRRMGPKYEPLPAVQLGAVPQNYPVDGRSADERFAAAMQEGAPYGLGAAGTDRYHPGQRWGRRSRPYNPDERMPLFQCEQKHDVLTCEDSYCFTCLRQGDSNERAKCAGTCSRYILTCCARPGINEYDEESWTCCWCCDWHDCLEQ